ncbi:MAG: hypothetical protein COV01_00405 [Candidatus Taylorbacteria bacterium CG10_big_fil_rev_8_21_14_0_10_41_48]|uniref:Uncharacterized protein n=1 Tax=Candidatus Taylorbacteria bacterium CG10_big_fil_rev_8_21_14_0_10_41_48 TaxID=1975024 RepID=A0A2M8LCY0_9BACT|nr:MAG: hypothetical protein COV01_00405 [Candidatus Taylorbacteria bacterium CG10_big_fil_rev_8_21_14_0_10_41_48]
MKLSNLFRKKDENVTPKKLEPVWFPVWEDTDLLEKIRHSIYKSNPKSFQTEVSINLKLVEYSYSVEEETLKKIPLVSVGEIMSKFETVSPEEFSKLSPGEEFIPKIAKVENTVAIIGDMIDGFVIQIEEMEKHELPNTNELRKLLAQVVGNKKKF